MATVKSVGKSGFLKELFVDHPDVGKAEVDKAWQAAGNEGTISESLIGKTRRILGLTGKSRVKAEVGASVSVGAVKRSLDSPNPDARRAGPKATGRTSTKANGGQATEGVVRPARSGDQRTRVLIRLEGQIDDLLHEVKLMGSLPEFEETLRRARRILARSHGE